MNLSQEFLLPSIHNVNLQSPARSFKSVHSAKQRFSILQILLRLSSVTFDLWCLAHSFFTINTASSNSIVVLKNKMLSTRAVSQAVWKYVSATSVLAAGSSRPPTAVTTPTPKLVLPSGARTEGKSLSRWSAVSSSARIFRKYIALASTKISHFF